MVKPDFIIGILGNIVSILTFIASPIGAFGRLVRTKSSNNYDGLPYVSNPDDVILIVTVNSVKYLGLLALDLIFLGIVIVVTLVAFHGEARRSLVGVLCATFTVFMYGAPPLSIVRTVIKTKSVVYMPFSLSLSLFVNASIWLTFALLVMDFYVLIPNAAGIVLGSLQLIVYFIYKNNPPPSKTIEMMDEGDMANHTKETSKAQDLEGGQ